jgi:hypothetical protein
VNRASLATRLLPERKFAGSLADRAGLEPAVALFAASWKCTLSDDIIAASSRWKDAS